MNNLYVDPRWPTLMWEGDAIGKFKDALEQEEVARQEYERGLVDEANYMEEPHKSRALERIARGEYRQSDAPNLHDKLKLIDQFMSNGEPVLHRMLLDYDTGWFICLTYRRPQFDRKVVTLAAESFVLGLVRHTDGRWGTHS